MTTLGYEHTEETKAKLSEIAKNRSPEHRAKISEALKGRKQTPEHRAKVAASKTGVKLSPEHCKNISEGQKGRKQSPETRKKISETKKGVKCSSEAIEKSAAARRGLKRSEETCNKMSAALKGKKRTPEYRAKLSELRRGIKLSPETCVKISEALKGENNPNWLGGLSFEPYCIKFNNDFKERTRDFYGRVCVECGKTEEQNGKKHCVHHVLYNKQSCCDDSKPLFVILCMSCHTKTTNGDREYWEEHFTDIINNEYGGKCYYSKEEYELLKQTV